MREIHIDFEPANRFEWVVSIPDGGGFTYIENEYSDHFEYFARQGYLFPYFVRKYGKSDKSGTAKYLLTPK